MRRFRQQLFCVCFASSFSLILALNQAHHLFFIYFHLGLQLPFDTCWECVLLRSFQFFTSDLIEQCLKYISFIYSINLVYDFYANQFSVKKCKFMFADNFCVCVCGDKFFPRFSLKQQTFSDLIFNFTFLQTFLISLIDSFFN